MIDLRYHIVSIMAVFLALALGILIGSSVVRTPLDAALNEDLQAAINNREEAQAEARQLSSENEALKDRLGPWALHERLEGASFIVISDGPTPDWRGHVLAALKDAGAEASGTIVLEDRWQLAVPEDREELTRAIEEAVGIRLVAESPEAAFDLFGDRFFDQPAGPALIEELESAGFISVPDRPSGDWPAPGSLVVVLSGATRAREGGPAPSVTDLVTSVASGAPGVLVVSDSPEGRSLVTMMREMSRLPDNIATFDAATKETDPGGVGVVAALVAATEERGGHFGMERGRTFVAPPSAEK